MEEGVPTIHMAGFDKGGEKVELTDNTCRPYLLCDYVEIPELKGSRVETVRKKQGLKEKNFWKIEGTNPARDIPKWREALESEGIQTYEADIFFVQVYMKERGIVPSSWNLLDIRKDGSIWNLREVRKPAPKLRTLTLDCEYYEFVLTVFLRAENRIHKVYALRRKDEKKLMENLRDLIIRKDPDIIFTYYGNESDWKEYIIPAIRRHKVKFSIGTDGSEPHVTEYGTISIRGRPTVDLYGCANLVKARNNSLPEVHKALERDGLVPKRVYYEMDGTTEPKQWIDNKVVGELWKRPETRHKVFAHCASDVIFTQDIGDLFLPYIIEMSRITKIPLDQVLSVSEKVLMEGYLMRYAKRLNQVIPNSGNREHYAVRGAIVIPPKKGLLKNIAVLDFKSMFPMVAIANNLSFETYDKEAGVFLKEPKGMFAIAIEELMEELELAKKKFGKKFRKKYAGEVQAIKTLARAMSPHGYLGHSTSRWYSWQAADMEHKKCRELITKTIFYVRKLGFEVVYGDTDSVFVVLPNLEESVAEFLCEKIKRKFGFDISYELYRKVFFTEAKKKYSSLDLKGNVDISGFEAIRGDWCSIATRHQKNVIETILKVEPFSKAIHRVKNMTKAVLKMTTKGLYPLKDYIIWKSVRKPLSEYESRLAHVEVAKRMGLEAGELVPYLIVKGDGYLYEKARHPTEVKDISELDFEYYRNKQVIPVTNRILGYFLGEEIVESLDKNYFKV